MITRRHFLHTLTAAAASTALAAPEPFRLRYILSSAMYGEMPLDVILPEVAKAGCEAIDIWCKVHGNQREQVTAMGDDAFAALLAKHGVKLGVSTRYPLGPMKLQEEMAWVKKLSGKVVLCGSGGPKDVKGAEARAAVAKFLEDMKPHIAKAEELGVTIAIENHLSSMLAHPDSIKAFAELNRSRAIGVAFAPHHLHPWPEEMPGLIRALGGANLPFIYFQEHPPGLSKDSPKEVEMKQMPGAGGGLDYRPIVKALRDVGFSGYASIFMHPTPRGIPILPTAPEITAAINRSRAYIEQCLNETA